MKIIKSRTNPIIKKICMLHTKKGRLQQKLFFAEGTRTINTLLEHNAELKQLYLSEEKSTEKINFPLKEKSITIVSHEVMQKISYSSTCSGYFGVFAIPEAPTKKIGSGLVLLDVSDPGNVGTLIRTATALNKKTIILINSVDPWSPKVIQSSAGTIAAIEIYIYTWQELIEQINDITLCALVAKGGKKIESSAKKNTLLVVGNEAHGLPADIIDQCQVKITLPMPGKTESLNAAIAGSIALYMQHFAA